jgi:hypothetical protein
MLVSIDAASLMDELRSQVRGLGYLHWDQEAMRALPQQQPDRPPRGRHVLAYLDWFIELQRALRGQDVLAPLAQSPIRHDPLAGIDFADCSPTEGMPRHLPERRALVERLERLRHDLAQALEC